MAFVMGVCLADCFWRARRQGRQGHMRPGFAMMNVPTLWTIFIINFLALGLVWAYVARSYPKFEAAPFWTGSSRAAAAGAGLAVLRLVVGSPLPPLIRGTSLIFPACLPAMGIKRFCDQAVA